MLPNVLISLSLTAESMCIIRETNARFMFAMFKAIYVSWPQLSNLSINDIIHTTLMIWILFYLLFMICTIFTIIQVFI